MPIVLTAPRTADDERELIARAVRDLRAGKLVAFPTETVYGIAADAAQPAAVARLLEIKGRRPGQPLALAVKNAAAAFEFCPDVSPVGRRLARRCWPGPLTLVLSGSHPDGHLGRLAPPVRQAVAPVNLVGLRVPDHRFLLATLQQLPGPLTLTSANRSGQADAVSAEEVVEALGDDVDLVLSDGRSRYAQPSSVVRIQGRELEILRAGVLSESALRRFASLIILVVCTGNTCRSPMAQVLLQRRLADELGCRDEDLAEAGVMVISAGVAAHDGAAASEEAVQAMQARGLDLSHHESRSLTDVLLRFADLVLTMTRGHRDAILSRWPEAGEKTHLICLNGADVQDPIGCHVAEYESCARQIDSQLPAWVARLDLASLPVIKAAP